jgi:hypothetical protein
MAPRRFPNQVTPLSREVAVVVLMTPSCFPNQVTLLSRGVPLIVLMTPSPYPNQVILILLPLAGHGKRRMPRLRKTHKRVWQHQAMYSHNRNKQHIHNHDVVLLLLPTHCSHYHLTKTCCSSISLHNHAAWFVYFKTGKNNDNLSKFYNDLFF